MCNDCSIYLLLSFYVHKVYYRDNDDDEQLQHFEQFYTELKAENKKCHLAVHTE